MKTFDSFIFLSRGFIFFYLLINSREWVQEGSVLPRTDLVSQYFSIFKYVRNGNRTAFVSIIDFKKAYDSVYRETLIGTMQGYGVEIKTIDLMKLTLANTTSKVK